ncbi:hypothetical protein PInf_019857 [Phytophthora infestans]|nr:hypothetical protein PInf_019857 [Phytophthora infestans]
MGLFRQKKKSTHAGEKDEKVEADIPPPLMTMLKSVQEMDRKPPVTLALMGGNTRVFYRFFRSAHGDEAWLELLITYLLVPKLPLLAQAAGLVAGYIYVVTPNAEALVGCASRHVHRLLIRFGLIKRPFQWYQIWSKFMDSMQRRKKRRAARKEL